jgi:hypothetical protein
MTENLVMHITYSHNGYSEIMAIKGHGTFALNGDLYCMLTFYHT